MPRTIPRRETGSPQPSIILSNPRAIRDHATLGNDDDAVADVIVRRVEILRLAVRRDYHAVADARVFVDDRVVDHAVAADAQLRAAAVRVVHVVEVRPHDDAL